MLAVLFSLVVSQAPDAGVPPVRTVVVLDVSAEDAIYGDESRALCDEVVEVFVKAGFSARRVEEDELPRGGCRFGPCLEKVAKGSDVLVTLDAVELDKSKTGVATTALAGRTGMPLAGGRYHVTPKGKRPAKELTAFAAKVLAAFAPRSIKK